MGTRSIICVWQDGDWKVAQYASYDGYWRGQGVDVLKFLRRTDLATFAEKVRLCGFLSNDDVGLVIQQYARSDGSMTVDEEDAFNNSEWAHLSREIGAKVLDTIMQRDGVPLQSSIDGVADYFPYVYVIDLDKRTFETYRGQTNYEPLEPHERFYGYFDQIDQVFRNRTRYPPRLEGSWSLDALPSVAEFLRHFYPNMSDYEAESIAEEHLATVTIVRRSDGGYRVRGEDITGLHLSHGDPEHISRMIVPTVLALREANG